MILDRAIIVFAIFVALMVAFALRVDSGMDDIECGSNGLGGKTCVHVGS